jgi:hypothetical protein
MQLLDVEDIHGPISGADLGEPVPDGFRSSLGGPTGGLFQGVTMGEQRRERRRVRTPGSVRRLNVVTGNRNFYVALAVVKVVDGLVPVSTGDDDGRGAHVHNRLR